MELFKNVKIIEAWNCFLPSKHWIRWTLSKTIHYGWKLSVVTDDLIQSLYANFRKTHRNGSKNGSVTTEVIRYNGSVTPDDFRFFTESVTPEVIRCTGSVITEVIRYDGSHPLDRKSSVEPEVIRWTGSHPLNRKSSVTTEVIRYNGSHPLQRKLFKNTQKLFLADFEQLPL